MRIHVIHVKDFRVEPHKKVRLKQWPTLVKPFYASQNDYKGMLQRQVEELSKMEHLHYASGAYALLIIFQGMDAAGKDGAITHVMSGVNPQGCDVFSFKQPSETELKHDFLWRAAKCLPERGKIGIFNRSYYEDVLVVRVHGENTLDWSERYRSITGFERHLYENNTRIVKIFLHLSKEEQRKRFLERIDNPDKNWKLSASDLQERKFWKRYREAYEECLEATSTAHAPWHIVPADDKDNARLIVSRIILDTVCELKLSYPKITPKHRRELEAMRRELTHE